MQIKGLSINSSVNFEWEKGVMGIKPEVVGKQSLNFILMPEHAGNFWRIDEGRKMAKRTS